VSWETVELQSVAALDRNAVRLSEINGDTAYIGLEHVSSEGQVFCAETIDSAEVRSNKFLFNKKHILFGKLRPYLRKIARPSFSGVCSTDIIPILVGDKLNRDFLYHFLRTPAMVEFATGRCSGANLPRLSPKQLAVFKIPLPPLSEQKRIAGILDKADAIRRKRQQAIELTEQFLRSTFLDMFGDPVTNPKGWPVGDLGRHLDFLTSGSRGWAKYYSPSGARFIRSLDVQMNYIGEEEIVYVDAPKSTEANRTRVEPGDVLLTVTGSKIGRVAPIAKNIGAAHISQHVMILRLGDELRPRFLSMYLSDPRGGQHQIKRMQYGQTKPGLNMDQVRKFQVPCPPVGLQDRFLEVWDRYNIMRGNFDLAKDVKDNLFNSLVQRAFRGEL